MQADKVAAILAHLHHHAISEIQLNALWTNFGEISGDNDDCSCDDVDELMSLIAKMPYVTTRFGAHELKGKSRELIGFARIGDALVEMSIVTYRDGSNECCMCVEHDFDTIVYHLSY